MPLSGSIPPISSAPPVAMTREAVRGLALAAGFTEAGVVALPYAETARDAGRFTEFVEKGRAGTMSYLARRNEEGELVRGRVQTPFPWARSAVIAMASYHADAPLSTARTAPEAAWIARYAWTSSLGKAYPATGERRPSDYHKVLLKRLRALEAELHGLYGAFESRAYVDTGPLVERSVARAAGLGWVGKNTCLIHPRHGSFSFLGALVTALPVAEEQVRLTVPDRCGSCRRCLDACPTGALFEAYQMDATRCISYLTIEHKGEIGEDLMAGMGRQVFGCDICQDVCPWNRKAPIGHDPELAPRAELVNPTLEWLAELEEADFERLFNGSPVRRAGFQGLRRNIAIAMGNSGVRRFVPWLKRWASEDDSPSEKVRSAAAWALTQILRGKNDREKT